MQFESNAGFVVPEHLRQPVKILRDEKFFQAAVPLKTTPMILAKSREHCVAERQLCLGNVASDKISVVGRKGSSAQSLAGQEQPGATVHQETRGFRQRNPIRLPMVFATDQEFFFSEQPSMPHDKVIIEHV